MPGLTTHPNPKESRIYKVLAIDPGQSTGVATFRRTRLAAHLLEARTLVAPYKALPGLIEDADEVCCETPPKVHRLQPETVDRVLEVVRQSGRAVHYVKPSQWKGNPHARLLESDRQATDSIHARDACSMGRWFIAMRRLHVIKASDAEAPREEIALPIRPGRFGPGRAATS